MTEEQEIIKTPFNDRKHIPTRAEIELALGVLGAIYLKELEHKLDLQSRGINWSMYWHAANEGWSSRASYNEKVLCVVHFYKKFFIVSIPIPLASEEEFRTVKQLTPVHLKRFDEFTSSPGTKWITLRVGRKEDLDSLLSVLKKKINLLKLKEESAKKSRRNSGKE